MRTTITGTRNGITRPKWIDEEPEPKPADRAVYNRSSLAVDQFGEAAASWPQPMPHLISRRYAAAAPAAPTAPQVFKSFETLSFKRSRKSNVVSFILHVLVISAVLWWSMTTHPRVMQTQTVVTPVQFTLYAPPPPPPPQVMPVAKIQGGGGGGGAHHLIEPTRGRMPRVAHIQTLAPQIIRIAHPKLAVEPTMQVSMPTNSALPNLGMPQSQQVALASQGSGSGSGFGHGIGGGIGASHGNGAGTGTGGGYGGGVMSVGGGVSAPVLIHSAEPGFTDQARQANYTGTVAIQLIVDAQGNPQDVRVVRHLGMGLDEKAIEAVRQYRFRPAVYQGHPVAVQMIVEVDFHLH